MGPFLETFIMTVILELQAYSVFNFVWHYALPVGLFVYCYGRIFHTIRRQNKIISGHVGHGRDVPMATTSRDPNTGQVQQQATGAATSDARLSRTEMNILKTMIYVVVCFILCWTPSSIAIALMSITVSLLTTYFKLYYF